LLNEGVMLGLLIVVLHLSQVPRVLGAFVPISLEILSFHQVLLKTGSLLVFLLCDAADTSVQFNFLY